MSPPPAPSPRPPAGLLTARARLSPLGMCSRSTQGWAKKSWKEMRRLGSRSRSRCSRSLQSRESGGRRGSCGEGGRQITRGPSTSAPSPEASEDHLVWGRPRGTRVQVENWSLGKNSDRTRCWSQWRAAPSLEALLLGALRAGASPLPGSLLGRLGLACLLCSHRGPTHNRWGRPFAPCHGRPGFPYPGLCGWQ